ncbi:hypothetical protein [Peribacillus sp. SCS-155]|uniref:hypothetical protein n=1 Tax=Peribacillus sedimenti TaxID=3115297 RepID=UPI0039060842
MDKWNDQAAPNNNLPPSSMEPENHASKRMEIEGMPEDVIEEKRTEVDIRSANLDS